MADGTGAPAGDGAPAVAGTETSKGLSVREAMDKAKAKTAAPKAEGDKNETVKPATPAKAPTEAKGGDEPKAAAKQPEGKEAPAKPASESSKDEGQADAPKQSAEQPKPADPAVKPPPGWSAEAKAEFANLSPSVQQAIAKREAEVDQGFKQYSGLKPYADMAARSNTSLESVLRDLSRFEDTVARDPVQAIQEMAAIYGFPLKAAVHQLAQATGLLNELGGEGQLNGQQHPQQSQQQLVDPRMVQLERQLDALTHQIASTSQTQVKGEVETFANDPANKHWDAVADDVARVLQSDLARYRAMSPGQAVKEAYDIAIWANPDVRQQLIKEQTEKEVSAQLAKTKAVADQARDRAKSVTGAPTQGVSLSDKPKPTSIKAAVKAARGMVEA